MRHVFRIHGLDMDALSRAETVLRRLVRGYALEAEISIVNEYLEHGRLGISHILPALEINGILVSTGKAITENALREMCMELHRLSAEDRGRAE